MLINKIIAWLEAGAPHVGDLHGFHYGSWIIPDPNSDCGTLACIAGAAVQFATEDFEYDRWEREFQRNGRMYSVFDTAYLAQELLGLTQMQADLLFAPFELENEWLEDTQYFDPELSPGAEPLAWTWDLKPEQVAVVLKHFALTGNVNWELAREPS